MDTLPISVRWENHLFLNRVTILQSEQTVRLSPVIWLSTCSTPPTTHAVLSPCFTLVGCDPHQKVLHGEHSAVLTDVRQSDRTSFFDFSDHVPQEIRAPPHDTLHDVVPSLGIFPNLTPHFTLEPSFFARLRQTLEVVAWYFSDPLVHFLQRYHLSRRLTRLRRLVPSLPGFKVPAAP